jgi:hypothetical protein
MSSPTAAVEHRKAQVTALQLLLADMNEWERVWVINRAFPDEIKAMPVTVYHFLIAQIDLMKSNNDVTASNLSSMRSVIEPHIFNPTE